VPYLLGVNNGHVQFAYNGWYKNLVRDRIKPEEIAWVSELLGRLSDKQWNDAFRAAGYEPAVANISSRSSWKGRPARHARAARTAIAIVAGGR
jgi:hypothetical protein